MITRLKQRSEFLRVARAQRKWVTPGLIVQARPRSEAETPDLSSRIGFTVSRKVGNAVQRNRAKRRLRAIVDQVFAGTGESGHDFVIIGRQQTLTRPFGALIEDLINALRKLGVYKSATKHE